MIPPGTQPGAGGPVQGTEMSRGLWQPHKHPGTPPRAHPPTHPALLTAWAPRPTGGEKIQHQRALRGGDPPEKKGGAAEPPLPATPSPKYCSVRGSTSVGRGGGALPGGGGSARPSPTGERHGGTGEGLRPGRACKQLGWGVNKALWGTPTPAKPPGSVVGGPSPESHSPGWGSWGQAPWLSMRTPGHSPPCPGWGSQGPTPLCSVGSLELRLGVLSPSAQHRNPQPFMGTLGPSPPLNTGTFSPADPPSPL